jgi:hypothetical protein
LIDKLAWIKEQGTPPSEDEAMLIVTAIEDLSALLNDQIEQQ